MADMISFAPEKEDMMKSAIGELLELAGTTNVKKAIGTYSYAKGYSTNLDKIKQLCSTILEEYALFLQLKVRDEFNSKTYKNRQVLADRIIMKIESNSVMSVVRNTGSDQEVLNLTYVAFCVCRDATTVKISQLDLNGLVRKPVERSLEQFGYVEGAD